jgi:hypothetical protein
MGGGQALPARAKRFPSPASHQKYPPDARLTVRPPLLGGESYNRLSEGYKPRWRLTTRITTSASTIVSVAKMVTVSV